MERVAGFAGPGGVGAVQDGRAGVAVAAGPLAAGGAAGERAGQGDADPGEFGLDLLVAAGRVVHGDRIPYPPRRRHPPLACLNSLYFKHGCPSRGRCGGRGLARAAGRRVTAPALRGLSRFAGTRGVPAGREFLLDYDVIEAFCVAGLRGRASSTRGTYRSALYRLAEAVHGPAGQRATPFPGAKAPAPYSPAERAELAAVAAAQRDPAKRASALALVVFGIGAGLRPGELVALRGGDVTRRGRQVVVCIRGPAARVVPVTAGLRPPGLGAGPPRGQRAVFRPGPADRGYKNFVTNFARAWPLTRPPPAVAAPGPGRLHLRSPGRGHPGPGAARGHRDRRGRVAGPLRPPRGGHQLLQGRPAGPLPRGAHPVSGAGLTLPAAGGGISDQTVAFAAELTDRSGKAPVIEAALAHRTGRPRPLPVRAVLTALLCLALDDRPLFLTDATRLLFQPAIRDLPQAARRPRHRPHRAGLPGRLPPGPLLLRRHLPGHGPLGAAEKPPAEPSRTSRPAPGR